MTHDDTRVLLAWIKQTWFKIDWPGDVKQAFARRIRDLPLSLDQAMSVLMDVRLSTPFKNCEPSDLLVPLAAVAKAAKPCGRSTAAQDDARLVQVLKASDPALFWELAEKAHRAIPEIPPHYRQAPTGYWDWAPARDFLANLIRQTQSGARATTA